MKLVSIVIVKSSFKINIRFIKNEFHNWLLLTEADGISYWKLEVKKGTWSLLKNWKYRFLSSIELKLFRLEPYF